MAKRDLPRKQGERMTAKERAKVQDTFLAAFAASGIILVGCRAAGVARTTVQQWQEHDDNFSIRYQQARLEADDQIRAEIHRRAVTGVDRPIYQGGQRVGVVREYSDGLLRFLAQSRMAEFREKVDVSGEVRLTIDQLDKILEDA